MNRTTITRILGALAITISIAGITPISANAEWKQDQQTGWWWYADGDSWYTGWKQIDGKWYYFYGNGYMADDTRIDGYTLGKDGAWIEQKSSVEENQVNSDQTIADTSTSWGKYDFGTIGSDNNIKSSQNIADSSQVWKEEYLPGEARPTYVTVKGERRIQEYSHIIDTNGKEKWIPTYYDDSVSQERREKDYEEYKKRNTRPDGYVTVTGTVVDIGFEQNMARSN